MITIQLYFLSGAMIEHHVDRADWKELTSDWDDWMVSERNPVMYTINGMSFRLDQLLAIKVA